MVDGLRKRVIQGVMSLLIGPTLAYALVVPFGYAAYLGLARPEITSAEIVSAVRNLIAGPLYQWSLRGLIALLAFLAGLTLARRQADDGRLMLINILSAALASFVVLVLARLTLDLIFQTPAAILRAVLDGVAYAISLGWSLLGAWLGRRPPT